MKRETNLYSVRLLECEECHGTNISLWCEINILLFKETQICSESVTFQDLSYSKLRNSNPHSAYYGSQYHRRLHLLSIQRNPQTQGLQSLRFPHQSKSLCVTTRVRAVCAVRVSRSWKATFCAKGRLKRLSFAKQGPQLCYSLLNVTYARTKGKMQD